MAIYRVVRADGGAWLDQYGREDARVWQASAPTKKGTMMKASTWAQDHFCPVELQKYTSDMVYIPIAKYDPAVGKWEYYKN